MKVKQEKARMTKREKHDTLVGLGVASPWI